jgi:hypothetical protein
VVPPKVVFQRPFARAFALFVYAVVAAGGAFIAVDGLGAAPVAVAEANLADRP